MCPLLHPLDTYIRMLLLVAVQANGSTAGGSIESGERDNVRICQMLYTSTLATLRREEQGRVLYIGQVPWRVVQSTHPHIYLPTSGTYVPVNLSHKIFSAPKGAECRLLWCAYTRM